MIVIHSCLTSPGSKVSPQAARVFRPGREFTHLTADTEEELRGYASKMRIPLIWIQHPGTPDVHFDVTGTVLARIKEDPHVKQMTLREWSDWRKTIAAHGQRFDSIKSGDFETTFSLQDLLSFVPEREREAVLERAAIMEFDGNQPREIAESNALLDWRKNR